MIFITGNCHGDFSRFSEDPFWFPQQKEMTREDFVIVCGNFGIWCNTNSERWWLDWLSKKNFTLLFVDGNNENFDRLYGDEFEVVDFHGGKAHKIRKNIYHLMRGYVFTLEGKKFFAFGGARSHDIDNGILDVKDYPNTKALVDDYNRRTRNGQMLRINHSSWWKEEMPSPQEMKLGLQTLKSHDNKVDFIISQWCPQEIVSAFPHGAYEPDQLTKYFNIVAAKVDFSKWFFGHYEINTQVPSKYVMLHQRFMRIV